MLKDNLILLRTLKGLSQEHVAEQINISRQAYAKWEKGDTIPDVEKCALLADFYGTTVDELLKSNKNKEGMEIPPAPKGKHIFGTVTMSERGQIVIPKAARDTLNVVAGDRLVVLGDEGEGIALLKADLFEKRISEAIKLAQKNIKNYMG